MSKKKAEYSVQTGQEANAMMRAVSDGKSGRHWQTVEGKAAQVHQAPGASHYVQLVVTDGDRDLGFSLASLESATLCCDSDDVFILLYISRLLTPAAPLPKNTAAMTVVELDSVIKAVGWYPQNTLQRAEMRRRVWKFLKWVAKAHIVGQRTYKHRDAMTGEDVDTFIDSPPWTLGGKVREGTPQPSLFEEDEPPLSVEVTATAMWTRLTALPDTAQFLPMGEALGAIPGGKPAGAWARVIGLALASFWRRNPRTGADGILKPTRRELLERYTPSTGPVADVLNGNDPRRALQYWATALNTLADSGFLANDGEVTLPYEAQRDALDGYKWQEAWLDSKVDLRPGPAMIAAVNERAARLPKVKPRNYRKSKRHKTAGNE